MIDNALSGIENNAKCDHSQDRQSTKNKPFAYEVVRVEMEDETLIEEIAHCIAQMILRYGQNPD